MSAQFSFESLRQVNEFGGKLARGKRKVRRPIVTKRPMHLILKSSFAVGKYSLLQKQNAFFVSALVARLAARFGIRIYEFSNNGNHLHLLVQCRDRNGFRNFNRTLSALIARFVTGARKGKALVSKFWDAIPFTRVVEWGRDFFFAKNYVLHNQLEAAGRVPYSPRDTRVPWHLGRDGG